MKKIFLGISNILLVTIMFVYLFISCSAESDSILSSTAQTGLPIIGIIFLIPAFIFTIIDLTHENKVLVFIRNMFSFFASLFYLTSAIIFLCTDPVKLMYVPIILLVCATLDAAFTGYGIVRAILNEDKEKKNPNAASDVIL